MEGSIAVRIGLGELPGEAWVLNRSVQAEGS